MLLLALIAAVAGFFWFDLGQYMDLGYLKTQQEALRGYVAAQPLAAVGIFFTVYVLVTALSLPGAAVMTLAGGAIFGFWSGVLIISFASTLGATLAFLIARFLLRETVARRFGERLAAIDRGIAKDGPFYLFTLRLVPLFPFFIINLAMGLTAIRTGTFWWVSQLGMLPGTLVYVNAGTQLARIDSLAGILSPGLLLSFALLGLFPLLAKKGVDLMKSRQTLRTYPRPKRFDRNLVVIGAGSGGLVASYIAAALKARVTLIEKHKMGGDCLNTGCVPSKALLRSAKFISHARRAEEFGIHSTEVDFDFAQVMERVQTVVRRIEPHDSVARYQGLGVDVIEGEARIRSPYEVEVNDRILTTRAIVIAAGASPLVPPIPGLTEAGYLSSDSVWNLRQQPKRLAVLGGGPIGSELAQAFARLGSEVVQVEMGDRLLAKEDPEISQLVLERFRAEGIDVRLSHKAAAVRSESGQKILLCEHAGEQVEIHCDEILVALGRSANVQGYGLEELGVRLSERKTVEVNEFLQTNYPNIYAVGDVAGPYQFTHTAAHQAWYAAVNALFGSPLKRFKADYSVIPWATFTDPEVARVGLSETEAKAQNIAYEVTTFGLDDLDRAIADSEAHGLVKVLTVPGKDKILGVTIVGEHAGDLIAEYVLAMRHGLGLNKILGTIHIYPTLAEANKYAAGAWRRTHAPQRLLEWVRRFHDWRRGGMAGEDPESIQPRP
jgi:dihydrolipoamide dehydrogenase